jgi:histone chaperone ASF1
VGVTAILLTASYNKHEFFRVGYYVNNYYEEQELCENPPIEPLIDRLTRHILIEKPRVTKFAIDWDDQPQVPQNVMSNEIGNEENMNYGNMMMPVEQN